MNRRVNIHNKGRSRLFCCRLIWVLPPHLLSCYKQQWLLPFPLSYSFFSQKSWDMFAIFALAGGGGGLWSQIRRQINSTVFFPFINANKGDFAFNDVKCLIWKTLSLFIRRNPHILMSNNLFYYFLLSDMSGQTNVLFPVSS